MPRPKRDPIDREIVPTQERFIDEYMIDFNATRAAIRAGYSRETAHVQASRMLSYPNIKAEIAARVEQRRLESQGRAQKVIDDLHDIAASAVKDADKIRANELLGKHYGLFNDKIEHTHYNGGDAPQITANATAQQAIEVYAELIK